ncbi:hypothetical protein JKP88DRAFT_249579 [Tribonema minus]|uniref:Uncharacterized protein n=1 Tax=Tribonema minus TaxID=303371 RepID=A0A836C9H9_9STRA|nr:hypothetical protein JKP88DRAFT_249579 [Tribonema minus]
MAKNDVLPREAWGLDQQLLACVRACCTCTVSLQGEGTLSAVQRAILQRRQVTDLVLSGDFGLEPIPLPLSIQQLQLGKGPSEGFVGRLGRVPQGLVSLDVSFGAVLGLKDILRCMPGSLTAVCIRDFWLPLEELASDEQESDEEHDGEDTEQPDDAAEAAVAMPAPLPEHAEEADQPEQGVQAAVVGPAPLLLVQETEDGEGAEALAESALAWPAGVSELWLWNHDPRPLPPDLQHLCISFDAEIDDDESGDPRYMQPSLPEWFSSLSLPGTLETLSMNIDAYVYYDERCQLPALPDFLHELWLDLPCLAAGASWAVGLGLYLEQAAQSYLPQWLLRELRLLHVDAHVWPEAGFRALPQHLHAITIECRDFWHLRCQASRISRSRFGQHVELGLGPAAQQLPALTFRIDRLLIHEASLTERESFRMVVQGPICTNADRATSMFE